MNESILNSVGTVKWSEVDKGDVAVGGNVAHGVTSHDGQNHGQGNEYDVVESRSLTSTADGVQEATYGDIPGN